MRRYSSTRGPQKGLLRAGLDPVRPAGHVCATKWALDKKLRCFYLARARCIRKFDSRARGPVASPVETGAFPPLPSRCVCLRRTRGQDRQESPWEPRPPATFTPG